MVQKKSTNNLTFSLKHRRLVFIVCLIVVGYQFIPHSSLLAPVGHATNNISLHIFSLNETGLPNNTTSPTRTLVVYVYAKTHELAEENLAFFIRTAVRDSHNADYYFILQQINNTSFDEKNLPLLPSNAHYIQHENKCFDIGTVGWFLSSGMIDKTKYKYFIFLNSSVRGPFIVSYYDNPIWYTIFTRRLNDHIKLVGSTISCRIAPHVQSYFWALSLETLNLLKGGTVFTCPESKWGAIYAAEIGASQRILNSGFGIDSLMKKYQGVDFRLNNNSICNDGRNPTYGPAADGITLDPFEVVFVKMKNDTEQDLGNQKRVRVYEKWIHY